MSITRTGFFGIPAPEETPSGITMVSSDKVALEPGEMKIVDGTAVVAVDHSTMVGLATFDDASVTPHNPWAEVLSVLLGNVEPVQLEMSKEEWLALDDRFTSSMTQIGYNHVVELAKAHTNTVITFHHEETNRVVMIIHIADDNYAVSDSKADEFADSLKDL